jgi:hypothetical protein
MAMVDWTVTGQLETQGNFPEPPPPVPAPGTVSVTRVRPLPLADVDLSLFRLWVDDGELRRQRVARTRTDNDGGFTLTGRAVDEPARFQITARFRNDDLNVRPSVIASASVTMTGPGGTGFSINEDPPDDGDVVMTVFEDATPNAAFTRSVGALRFSTAAAAAGLNNADHIVRAIFWNIALRLARRLRRANPALAFDGRVHVIWPGHTIGGASYASHVADFLTQRQVHIDQNVDNGNKTITLLHEMMHIWNYDHNRGTTNWLKGVMSRRHGWDLDTNGDLFTPGQQEWPNIAFHEAFAEFAAEELRHELFGEPKPLPFRRARIAQAMGLAGGTAPQVGRSVIATMSALRCLTTPDLHLYRFGAGIDPSTPSEVERRTGRVRPVNPPWPAFTIFEILEIFLPGPAGSGFETAWQVGDRDFGIRQFLARAAALRPDRVTQPVRRLVLDLIDPTSTVEPTSLAQ